VQVASRFLDAVMFGVSQALNRLWQHVAAVAPRYVVQKSAGISTAFGDEAIMLDTKPSWWACVIRRVTSQAGIGFHAARGLGQLHSLAGDVGTGLPAITAHSAGNLIYHAAEWPLYCSLMRQGGDSPVVPQPRCTPVPFSR